MMSPLHRSIPGGTLTFELTRADLPLDDALSFATRRNPRRRFLFVSRLLGRHLPTPPAVLRRAAAALAGKLAGVALPGSCLFIGMSETATTLGQATWRAWHESQHGATPSLYLDTTRRPTGGPIAFQFSEDHSHAPLHLVHRPSPAEDPRGIFERAGSLIIVDDEVTTGRTALALAEAYAAWRGSRPTVHLLTLVHWQNGAPPAFECHSLIEGRFTFMETAGDIGHSDPERPRTTPTRAAIGTRHGLTSPQSWSGPPEQPGRVLVIGAGEFGFVPLLLAEQIEAAGGEAFVQATTRSPVLVGGAISHARCFPALDGEARDGFLYNVPDDHSYDRVLLCLEDTPPPPDHPLLSLPRLECRHFHA